MKRKRILMLAPDLGYGGAEKSFSRWAEILSENHEVIRVVFNKAGNNTYLADHNVISLDVPAGKNVFSKAKFFRERIMKLKKIKKELRPDVSISFLEGADYVNVLSRQSEKVILSIRGSKQYDSNISGMLGWLRHRILMPYLYNRADRITVVSEGIKQELREFYHVKPDVPVQVIYNFYDASRLKALAAESLSDEWQKILSNHQIIVCVGRVARQKNYPFMIRVFKKVKKIRPHVKLLILGDGEQKETLLAQAEELNLKAYSNGIPLTSEYDLYFAGMVKNPHAFVSRASLFVLPSLFEGFPNALAEAMIAGTPAAAANCPYGPAEIFGQPIKEISEPEFLTTGLLLPASEETANQNLESVWANALIKALDDKDWRAAVTANASQRMAVFNEEQFDKDCCEMLGS